MIRVSKASSVSDLIYTITPPPSPPPPPHPLTKLSFSMSDISRFNRKTINKTFNVFLTALPPVRNLQKIRNGDDSITVKWDSPYGFIEENVNFYIVEIDGSRQKTDQKKYKLPWESMDKEVKVSWKFLKEWFQTKIILECRVNLPMGKIFSRAFENISRVS